MGFEPIKVPTVLEIMGNSQKHTKAIYFTHNRDIWAFRAADRPHTSLYLAVFLLKDFIVAAQRFSIPDVRAPVNPAARCPSLLCSRRWVLQSVIRLQQNPLFVVCLCGSFQRLVGFVWGDYRQGACRSYLFIQVHASIPQCLSSSLSVERSAIFYKRGGGVSLYWAAKWFGTGVDVLKGAVGRASRRVPLHFSVNFHYCNNHFIVFCKNKSEKGKDKQIWMSAFVCKIFVPFINLIDEN